MPKLRQKLKTLSLILVSAPLAFSFISCSFLNNNVDTDNKEKPIEEKSQVVGNESGQIPPSREDFAFNSSQTSEASFKVPTYQIQRLDLNAKLTSFLVRKTTLYDVNYQSAPEAFASFVNIYQENSQIIFSQHNLFRNEYQGEIKTGDIQLTDQTQSDLVQKALNNHPKRLIKGFLSQDLALKQETVASKITLKASKGNNQALENLTYLALEDVNFNNQINFSNLDNFILNNNQSPKQFEKASYQVNLDVHAQAPKADELKIAHWNVLNFTSNKPLKRRAIASVILSNQYDLIALTEIADRKSQDQGALDSLNSLLQELNELQTTRVFSGLVSKRILSPNPVQKNQAEYVIYLWDSQKVALKNFANATNAEVLLYDQTPWAKDSQNTRGKATYTYARAPIAAHFVTLGAIKNDFTLVVSHFDSPGRSSSRGEASFPGFSGQGAQEIEEALQLNEVMRYFDNLDGINDDLIFMGDTNIKERNEAGAFMPLFEDNFSALLDAFQDQSSLGQTKDRYANSYDKIFYRGTLKASMAQRFNLWGIFDEGSQLIDFNSYKKEAEEARPNPKVTLVRAVRSISDHAPVSFILHLDANDTT